MCNEQGIRKCWAEPVQKVLCRAIADSAGQSYCRKCWAEPVQEVLSRAIAESAGQSLCRKCWKNVRENQDWLKETATCLAHGETVHKPNRYTQDTKGTGEPHKRIGSLNWQGWHYYWEVHLYSSVNVFVHHSFVLRTTLIIANSGWNENPFVKIFVNV